MSVLKKIEQILEKKKTGEILFILDFLEISDYDTVRKSRRFAKRTLFGYIWEKSSKAQPYYHKFIAKVQVC